MRFFLPVITFTTSFATMCYAMIIASIISDYTGEEVLAQCLTMGPYLLGLGLGSFYGDKVPENGQLKAILRLEWLSVILLPLIPIVQLILVFLFLNLSPLGTKLEGRGAIQFLMTIGGLFSFFAGVLGGAQLPLIIKKAKNISQEIILAINYTGPLLAGPFIVYCSSGALPVSLQITIVGFVQIAGLILIIGLLENRLRLIFTLIIPLSLLVGVNFIYPALEHFTIKSSYIGTKIDLKNFEIKSFLNVIRQYGTLERVRTSYQTIDLFTEPSHSEFGKLENSTLYLNRKPQFDTYSTDVYHQSMVYAGVNILESNPENVLILGAGDGLLLKEMKKLSTVKNITMVELDDKILEWSKDHPVISRLNEGSLAELDPRVKLIVGDAVSFLRTHDSKKKYDMILIDFPFPNGHELAKLYSTEFYRLVKNVGAPHGVITIDLPIQINADGELMMETKIIIKTMKSVGFNNMILFGPYASFLTMRTDGQKASFNYKKFPEDLAVSTKLNLVEIFDEDSIPEDEWKEITVNSMFWPRGL